MPEQQPFSVTPTARAWPAPTASRTAPELARRLRQAAHDGAQAEIARQVGEEAADAEGLAGVEHDLAPGEVREDGAGGVDRGLPLQADEALAVSFIVSEDTRGLVIR